MPIVITDDDVRRHLSMPECIEAMRVVFRDFAEGKAASLPRVRYTVASGEPDRSYYANVHVGAAPSFGTACVRAGSHVIDDSAYAGGRRSMRNPEPFNWSVVILYDIKTSEPLAFLHESVLSGMRVGATSAVAMDEIARPEAATLGLLGTGRQARAHCEAICLVRPIRRVQVFSPNPAHLAAFVADARDGVEIVAAKDARSAVEGADIVCSATNATEPALLGEWLADGQAVMSIANSDQTVTRREVDAETFKRASHVVVNDWDSVRANRQVELLELLDSGDVDRGRVRLLGDVVAGRASARSRPDNIVYYKSNTGLAMQFAAAGAILHEKLRTASDKVVPREWLASERYGIG